MKVSAKSLIVELLSAGPVVGDKIPVRQLVRAASVFGIAENSVRVAIVRLRAEGIVESIERGHYQLGPAARPINERVVSWRNAAEQMTQWDGSFIGVFTAHLPRTDRPALRRRNRALRLVGLRDLRPGLHVRPANLVGGVDAVRRRLLDLGLDREAVVFRMADLSEEEEKRARSLWDIDSMRAVYADLVDQLDSSREQMGEMPLRDAVRESVVLGREGIRQIVLDPLLPEPMVPASEREALIEAMQRYDAAGRVIWRKFLEDGDVE